MPLRTCCVPGCQHMSAKNKDLTFFSLPTDPRRRASWLLLIGREDLADQETDRSLNICEVHFNRRDFCLGARRKLLKQHALHYTCRAAIQQRLSLRPGIVPLKQIKRPGRSTQVAEAARSTLHLPSGDTAAPVLETRDCSTQTDKKTWSSTDCQTVPSLVWPPLPTRTQPLVDPLSDPLALAGLTEIRREDCEDDPDVQRFFKLCDKLLTKELAGLVKLQTILKLQNKVN